MIRDKQSKCHFDGRLDNSFIVGRSLFRVFFPKAGLISTVGHIDVLHGTVEEGDSWNIGAREASGVIWARECKLVACGRSWLQMCFLWPVWCWPMKCF